MNQKFHLMYRVPHFVRMLLVLVAVCLVGWFAWRAVDPAGLRHKDDDGPHGTSECPVHDRSSLEALPKPVLRQISRAAVTENATRPKWKGAGALPENEQQSLWQAFSQARHEIRGLTDHQRTMAENEGALYLASNPGQRLRARFLEDGLRLLPGDPSQSWSGVIGLDSAGQAASIVQEGSMIQYRHESGVTEWFDNRPDGIEHGFIVHGDSHLHQKESLTVPVKLDGLQAMAMDGGEDLRLVDSEGRTVLTYEHLRVWDADGVALAASMVPTSGGLEILVSAAGARFPVIIDPLILTPQAHLGPEVTGSGSLSDSFGNTVAVHDNTALIGAYADDDNGMNSGSVYVFVRSNSSWSLQQKLLAPDGVADDHFGEAISLEGDTALIGAAQAATIGKGKVYVFVRDSSVWSLQQTLGALDGMVGDSFGSALSLSANTALIGAPGDDDVTLSTGSAYVFVRSGTRWTQQEKLNAPDPGISDEFGFSVSLSGETALIGAYGDDTGTSSGTSYEHGSAYVFVRSGTSWSFQQKILAADMEAEDFFGMSVSVSGETALIGAYGDDTGWAQNGSAYVFVRNGTIWSQQQKLLPPDGLSYGQFGKRVFLSGDTAVVTGEGSSSYSSYGKVHVFTRTGSAWSLQQKITPPPDMSSGLLGSAISLSGDTLLIGTSENNGNDLGSGLVLVRENAVWNMQQRLTAGDGATYDGFGISVGIEGDTAIVGTPGDDDNGADSGSAYVFVRDGGLWHQQQKLIASDGAKDDFFGSVVSLSGESVLVGAHGTVTGSAYVFRRAGTSWIQEQKLGPSDVTSNNGFGKALSLSNNTALIGGSTGNGAVYVYQRSGMIWNLQQKVQAADGKAGDNFGVAVSLNNDTAVVGANRDDNKGEDSGSAYVFVRDGVAWTQHKILTASDGAAYDSFGSAVSISGDTVLIGASGDDDQGSNSGSAYVFFRKDLSWSQQQKLKSSDGTGWFFGSSVSLSKGSALIGAYGDHSNGTNAGSAYLYWRSGPNWTEQQKLLAPDGAAYDNFGVAVCVSDFTALVGASLDDGLDSLGGYARDQGSVYVFQNTNPDVDGDGLLDIHETDTGAFVSNQATGTDPFNPDCDGDGLSDGEEVNTHGTNPNLQDTDGDNYLDATEVAESGDPVDAAIIPEMRPQITHAKRLTFFSRAGVNYWIEGSSSGENGKWAQLVGPIQGTGQAVSAVVITPPAFLRVVESL